MTFEEMRESLDEVAANMIVRPHVAIQHLLLTVHGIVEKLEEEKALDRVEEVE
jgi:hypothetical protein